MAEDKKTPVDGTEAPKEVSDAELEQVAGGGRFEPPPVTQDDV